MALSHAFALSEFCQRSRGHCCHARVAAFGQPGSFRRNRALMLRAPVCHTVSALQHLLSQAVVSICALVEQPMHPKLTISHNDVHETLLMWFLCAVFVNSAFAADGLEIGSEVGAAFRGVDQASSLLFAASVQDQDTRFQAPWHLDRIDQRQLPLDGQFHSQVTTHPASALVW